MIVVKNFFSTLALLCVVFKCHAQNTIEVQMQDSVMAAQEIFVFRLNLTAPNTPNDTADMRKPDYYIRRAELMKQKMQEFTEATQKQIRNAGFLLAPPSFAEYYLSGNYTNNLAVVIDSPSKLKDFWSWLQQQKNITAVLQYAKSKNENAHYERLFKKLMEKATARAEIIAKQNGQILNKVVSVSEIRMPIYYPPNVAVVPLQINDQVFNVGYALSGTLTVKFSVK